MRALIFCPDQNLRGKADVTGAFYPEARAFARYWNQVPEEVIKRFPTNAPIEQRRATTAMLIKGVGAPVDAMAFFCHGWANGIQAGFLRQHAGRLAQLIAAHMRPTGWVAIYGCDTAKDLDDDTDDRAGGPGGDGGFADTLRDACEALGRNITVMGHATAGHCAWNPYARYFAPGCGGQGGHWYVEPNSRLWPRWIAALRQPRNSLRYRFFSMSPEEIADELRGAAPPPLVA